MIWLSGRVPTVSPENLRAKLGNTATVFCENIFTDEYPKSAAHSHTPLTPPFDLLRILVFVLNFFVFSNSCLLKSYFSYHYALYVVDAYRTDDPAVF